MCPLTSCGRFQNGSTEDVPVVIGTISVAYYLRPLSSSPSQGPFHEKARGLSPLAFSSSGFWEEMGSEDARIMTLRSSHSLAHFRPSACQPSPLSVYQALAQLLHQPATGCIMANGTAAQPCATIVYFSIDLFSSLLAFKTPCCLDHTVSSIH